MKNPVTPVGIDRATLRFVTEQLNHCATAVRPNGMVPAQNYDFITADNVRQYIHTCLRHQRPYAVSDHVGRP